MAEIKEKSNEEQESSYSARKLDVQEEVYAWLADQFKITETDAHDMLSTQLATTYLIVWPIMEKDLFLGFMQLDKIEKMAKAYAPFYNEMNLEAITRYFYNRYQNELYFYNLDPYKRTEKVTPTQTNLIVKEILRKPFGDLSNVEKLQLVMFVVYRYRNNIFHGTKVIDTWKKFSSEIEKCIEVMMSVVDCYNRHKKIIDLKEVNKKREKPFHHKH